MTPVLGCVLGAVALAILWATWPRQVPPPPNRKRRVELMVVHRGSYRSIEYVRV